jgi:hypothetical protein
MNHQCIGSTVSRLWAMIALTALRYRSVAAPGRVLTFLSFNSAHV